MSEYVVMPASDWKGICDATRSKAGTTDLLKSGEVAEAIEGIQAGGGGSGVYSLTLTADGGNAKTLVDAVCLAFEVKNGFYAKCSAENTNQQEHSRGLALIYCCGMQPNAITGWRYRNPVAVFNATTNFEGWDFITKIGDVFEIALF